MGDKILPLKTYKVAPDDYFKFSEVQDIFKEIKEETEAYCAGNRQISTDELGQRIFENLIRKGKKGEEDLMEFQNLDAEGKKEYCKKYLMANGAIDIVMQEEVDIPQDGEDDNIIELNQKTA
jgi:hypothetical protein